MSKLKIETGSSPAGERFSITVTEEGPYLVYGRPPLAEQFIMPNESNESWYFQQGRLFSTEAEPTAICRCGASHRKPYCDGSPREGRLGSRASRHVRTPLLDDAEVIDGGTLHDDGQSENTASSRASATRAGDAWTLTEHVRRSRSAPAGHPRGVDVPRRPADGVGQGDGESPSSSVSNPSLGLIEDVTIGSQRRAVDSGRDTHAARGRADLRDPEPRRRHAAAGSRPTNPIATAPTPRSSGSDDLAGEPVGETLPEEVY